MITPNGRFEMNTKICTSMSSYHPETWDSGWTVRTVLLGLLSFLFEDGPALGCVKGGSESTGERERLAHESWAWNAKHKSAKELFAERLLPDGPPSACRSSGEGEDEKGASSTTSGRKAVDATGTATTRGGETAQYKNSNDVPQLALGPRGGVAASTATSHPDNTNGIGGARSSGDEPPRRRGGGEACWYISCIVIGLIGIGIAFVVGAEGFSTKKR
ncbi:unnamed protein product [Amoebophrya sp. A25]|nr:unnamed protein product [Amoebophrya sp. A25]|eukprot:GSA25T00022247001.1